MRGGLRVGLADVERLDELGVAEGAGALDEQERDPARCAGSSSGGIVAPARLEQRAVADGAVADERPAARRRAPPGVQTRGPGVNTSPRRASITGTPPRERVERRDAGDRNVERQRERPGDRQADADAREAARAASDHDPLDRPRVVDEVVDRRKQVAGPVARPARPPDAGAADGTERRRGIKGQGRHHS